MSEEIKLNPSLSEYTDDSGKVIRPILQWDEDHKKIVKVGEEDIQANIDKRAQGMTLSEQLQRLARGDVSVLRDGEPFYGDVSDVPEMYGDAAAALDAKITQEAQKIAAEKKAKLEKAQADLKAAQENLAKAEKENKDA